MRPRSLLDYPDYRDRAMLLYLGMDKKEIPIPMTLRLPGSILGKGLLDTMYLYSLSPEIFLYLSHPQDTVVKN